VFAALLCLLRLADIWITLQCTLGMGRGASSHFEATVFILVLRSSGDGSRNRGYGIYLRFMISETLRL
jgi:hypothetical protein